MVLRHVLQRILSVLLPLSLSSLVYLYLYPVFHGCAFPVPSDHLANAIPPSQAFVNIVKEHFGYRINNDETIGNNHNNTTSSGNSRPILPPAPFRLLVLADPQIEGDSSLPELGDGFIDRLGRHWNNVAFSVTWIDGLLASAEALRQIFQVDAPRSLRAQRKRLDLFGNDFYLAHIYRTLKWWAKPSHVTVLGDLIGSQWVSDEEFDTRSDRFWNRVFKGGARVGDNITFTGGDGYGSGLESVEELDVPMSSEPEIWSNRIINIAGNHDIGYAGDITEKRIERFEKAFGRHNWDTNFEYPGLLRIDDLDGAQSAPSVHLVVLDSLLLDTPALNPALQQKTFEFLNGLIAHRSRRVEDKRTFTLLLTHLPLHKKAGVCTDAPNFDFFSKDDDQPLDGEPRFKEGGLREQNHISDYLSHVGILQGIFGMSGDSNAPLGGNGRAGLILTGHDHTGCDTVHYINRTLSPSSDGETPSSWSWDAQRYGQNNSDTKQLSSTPSVREVTLRSMMGEFGGYAGLLSLWFDSDPSVMEWKYEIVTCGLGVQHVWWAVHVANLIVVCMLIVWLVLYLFDGADLEPEHLGEPGESIEPAAKVAPELKKTLAQVRVQKSGDIKVEDDILAT